MTTQFRILASYLQARFNTDERGAALWSTPCSWPSPPSSASAP